MTALYRRARSENSLATDEQLPAGATAGPGFHIPYRHVATAQARALAPAWLAGALAQAEPTMVEWLARARRHTQRLAGLGELHAANTNAPRFDQDWFPGLDGTMAYTMAHHLGSRHIIEVGSGHSTRFMALAIADAGAATRLISVDPRPRKAIDSLCHQVHRAPLQVDDTALFEILAPGDVLFIDGSHVLMPGTDVDILFGAVLPRLRRGVLVHIHDIFLPDPYPDSWAWRGYNEQSLVTALLGASRFSIQFASAYLRRHRAGLLDGVYAPCAEGGHESSLWLRVEGDDRSG